MGKIVEFDPVIYPTRVWACKNDVTMEELDEAFYALDSKGNMCSFKESNSMPGPSVFACVYPVGHKESRWRGCLVYINGKCSDGVLAHEALHCMDWMCDRFCIKSNSFEEDEPRAYYLQWLTDRLLDFKRGKIKD